MLCVFLLHLIRPAVPKAQEVTAPHSELGAAPSSVHTQLLLACSSEAPCTRTDAFEVDPVPNGRCVLNVRNGDGHGTDEARSYEVFLNGEKVIPAHRAGNAQAPAKVQRSNTLKVILTGESFRRVLVTILCDAHSRRR